MAKEWNHIRDALPPIGMDVECMGHDGYKYYASLFDIDHATSDVQVRFIVSNVDKVQFAFPKLWRHIQTGMDTNKDTSFDKLVEDGTKQVGKGIAMDAIREALTGSNNLPPKGLLPTHDVKPLNETGSKITPLLVISYAFILTETQVASIRDKIKHAIRHTTWIPLVFDAQSESKVQAFGVEPPALDTLSIDELIDMIDGLKRIKEAAQGGVPGSMSKD